MKLSSMKPKEQLGKALFFLGEHTFLFILFFLVAAFLLGGSVWIWQGKAIQQARQQEGGDMGLTEDALEKVVEEWAKRSEKFRKAEEDVLRDLFGPLELTEE